MSTLSTKILLNLAMDIVIIYIFLARMFEFVFTAREGACDLACDGERII